MVSVSRSAEEPNYDRPPIDEVGIGVYFDPLAGFIEPHAGLFWRTVRNLYPVVQAQPRLEGSLEVLERSPTFVSPAVHLMGGTQGRTWLISADDAYVVQIQDNFFFRNWRKREAVYPHFDVLEDEYWDDFGRFRDFLAAEELAQPRWRQLEIAYINWIPDLQPSEFFQPANGATVNAGFTDALPEAQAWSGRYVVRDAGSPRGRIYAECQPSARSQPNGVVTGTQLGLVFRAPFLESAEETEVRRLMKLGSQAVVQLFTQLTTAEAHQHWGRLQ